MVPSDQPILKVSKRYPKPMGTLRIAPALLGGLCFLLLIMCSSRWPHTAHATDTPPSAFGLSLSGDVKRGINDETKGVSSVDLFLRHPLPWYGTPLGWHLNTYIWASIGWLKVGGKQTKLTSAGPLIQMTSPRGRWYLEAGTRAALLTNQILGNRNLGYPLEFISHGEVGLSLGNRLRIGNRIQHISNGGLGNRNPGINLMSVHLLFNH